MIKLKLLTPAVQSCLRVNFSKTRKLSIPLMILLIILLKEAPPLKVSSVRFLPKLFRPNSIIFERCDFGTNSKLTFLMNGKMAISANGFIASISRRYCEMSVIENRDRFISISSHKLDIQNRPTINLYLVNALPIEGVHFFLVLATASSAAFSNV